MRAAKSSDAVGCGCSQCSVPLPFQLPEFWLAMLPSGPRTCVGAAEVVFSPRQAGKPTRAPEPSTRTRHDATALTGRRGVTAPKRTSLDAAALTPIRVPVLGRPRLVGHTRPVTSATSGLAEAHEIRGRSVVLPAWAVAREPGGPVRPRSGVGAHLGRTVVLTATAAPRESGDPSEPCRGGSGLLRLLGGATRCGGSA